MKAGIITLYGNVNYGNKLQNYAVSRLLALRGVEATTFVPRSQPVVINYAWRAVRLAQRAMLTGLERERTAGFERFTGNTPVKYLLTDTAKRKTAREYDFLVLGSDQIWHPRAFNLREERFGSFFPSERVVCIAASFGVSELPQDCIEYYQEGLSRLEWISVREDDGAKLVKRLTGKDVPVLADPTIGLPVAEWKKVVSSARCPESKYVLLYALGGLPDDQMNILQEFAKQNNATLIDILDRSNPNYYTANPGEFIGLIENADCVFTDSFHASVFSMLFETPVNILKRQGSASNVFSRLETFAKTYGLEERILKKLDFETLRGCFSCDYGYALKVAETKRKELNVFIDGFIASLGCL